MVESTVTAPTISEFVRTRVASDLDHVALVVDGVAQLTLGEWIRRSSMVAQQLIARGTRRGDRIAVAFDEGDWIEYAVAHLGVHLAGGTAVTMSPSIVASEARQRLEYCDVSGVLHSPDHRPPRPGGWWTATVHDLESGPSDLPDPGTLHTDVADILYTSGTTGAAKPVAVTHENLTFATFRWGHLFADVGSICCAVPLGTNAGHNAIMLALTTGSTIHVLSSLDPATVARTIAMAKLELAVLTPAVAARLVASGQLDEHDLTCLTIVMFGSAAVPPAMVEALALALPTTKMLIGYGSTESAPALTSLMIESVSEHHDPGYYRGPAAASLGEPRRESRVKIVGGDGPVATGVTGEICLWSPAPARAYFRDPVATARVFRDGWTAMGDLGHLDADGVLHFFDRAGDAIARDGVLLSSLRVENVLYWHPQVVDAAVFGVPDPARGQLLVAAVELISPVPVDELLAFLAERLDADQLPDRVVVVDTFPRGPIGKILKRELRQLFTAG